ncbi:glycosyltransferase (plasmid) [Legionella adelaidensis]|uniref:Glycosyltransferase n=1 Tax=Legionella adelaidensis TaxID=45056 RepID=A0A0W0R0B2_9GAMM|nr:glycosyltransferase family 9 protein [Legionella adelaidensis]KTC64515.1 glycosyltransferase [Legionella adelaidensis]VEH85883.1 glycosyltransferase [Legionella adelaidensis]
MIVPLIRTLQANFPKSSLTWVISRPAYDLVEGMDGVEFIVIEKPNGFFDYWQFRKRLQGKSFDVLIAAQASFRANLLYPLIKARRKIGYDRLRAKDGHGWFVNEQITPGCDHTLDGFLKFAEPLGIKNKVVQWDLPISDKDREWANEQLATSRKPVFILNPAASKPERSWSIEAYLKILQHVKEKWQAELVVTGGPGPLDKAFGDKLSQSIEINNLIGKTKPKQLLALIEQADLLVCPDTGPSHMAAAVATPVIALHAVTSSQVSGPYPYRHLAVDYYPQAVEKILKKTTETNIWGTHAHGPHTMELIPVDAVIERIDSVFEAM